MKRSAMRAGMALCLWLSVSACAINPVSGIPEVALVTVEQEKQLGAAEADNVEATLGLFQDAALTAYLDALGQRLVEQSPRKEIPYQFHLVDMTESNAFALPGGYVYVTRGLLAFVNSEDELAGVVGHEIGHVAARHTVQKISRQGPFALITGVVSGVTGLVSPLAGEIVGGIGNFAQSLVFAPYSRGQEREADEVGQRIAAAAGWDPAGLSAFLTTMERDARLQSPGARRPSFFDSHPSTTERIADTARQARTLRRAARPPLTPSREEFLKRLDGLVVGPRAAHGVVLKQAYLHPDLDVFVQFPDGWSLENSPRQVAGASQDGKILLVLGAVAKGNDPLDGVQALEKAMGASLGSSVDTGVINGLPAAHAIVGADSREGKLALDLTWIAHRGRVYQLLGIVSLKGLAQAGPLFLQTAKSFRPLTPSERNSVKETRIRLVQAQGGETLDVLVTRTRSAWKTETVAVANALPANAVPVPGQMIKIAVLEPYSTR